MKKHWMWAVICITATLTLSARSTTVESVTQERIYTVGIVPQYGSQRLYTIWRPILNALEQRTDIRFKLCSSPTISVFENEFMAGDFDFAYMNPYHSVVAFRKQGYLPLIRDVGRTLNGVLVVRKDSPVQDVAQLDGKTVAFPSPNALGASLMIRADLNGIYNIHIQPKYVLTHSSVYLNVLLSEADAGGGVQKSLEQQKPEIRDNLRVIYKTSEVAPHPLTVHPHVPEDVRRKVQRAFLELGETQMGRELLSRIPIKHVGVATFDDYHALHQMGLERFWED